MNSRSVIIVAAVALAVLLAWEFLPSPSTTTPTAVSPPAEAPAQPAAPDQTASPAATPVQPAAPEQPN